MTTVPSSDILDRFAAIVGDRNAVRDAAEMAPRLVENRGLYRGASPLLLKPGSVEEVSAILQFASETGTPSCRRRAIPALSAGKRRAPGELTSFFRWSA